MPNFQMLLKIRTQVSKYCYPLIHLPILHPGKCLIRELNATPNSEKAAFLPKDNFLRTFYVLHFREFRLFFGEKKKIQVPNGMAKNSPQSWEPKLFLYFLTS